MVYPSAGYHLSHLSTNRAQRLPFFDVTNNVTNYAKPLPGKT